MLEYKFYAAAENLMPPYLKKSRILMNGILDGNESGMAVYVLVKREEIMRLRLSLAVIGNYFA